MGREGRQIIEQEVWERGMAARKRLHVKLYGTAKSGTIVGSFERIPGEDGQDEETIKGGGDT